MNNLTKKKISAIIILGFLIVTITFAFYSQNEKQPEKPLAVEQTNFNMELDEYLIISEYDYKTDDEMIEIANSIIAGNLHVHPQFTDTIEYSPDDFDWNLQYEASPNTYQLYLQSMGTLIPLTEAYLLNGNEQYLQFGYDFLQQWHNYVNSVESADNPFVWYDHGTALRSEIIIHFALAYEQSSLYTNDFNAYIVNVLNEHRDFLISEVNYTENHNHGVFQDRALIYLSEFLDDTHAFEIAMQRLATQIEFSFNSEMVHVENSPGYHIVILDLFIDIINFVKQFEMDSNSEFLVTDLQDKINTSLNFITYIFKPNGNIAEIGDTNGKISHEPRYNTSLQQYNNPQIDYISTLGAQGEMPTEKSKIFPVSGYYLYNSDWSQENYTNSTWKMFKSGYSSKTHKHADDLSFMMYSKGYDIFVDTGWYNYMTGNEYRDYFISSNAHNTINANAQSYSITDENSSNVGIYEYELNADYDYIKGFNTMYPDVDIDRSFYSSGDITLIQDDISSNLENDYTQLFHLSQHMEIINYDDNEVYIKLSDTGYYVRIKQLTNDTILEIQNGNDENSEYGILSKHMNHLQSIDTLIFKKTASSTQYITLITIEDKDGNVMYGNNNENITNIKDIHFNNNTLSTEKFDISLKTRTPLDVTSFTSYVENSVINIENTNQNLDEQYSYLYYFIDKETALVLHKTEWANEDKFSFDLNNLDSNEILVKVYIRDGTQRKSSIIASYKKDNNTYINITDEYSSLNLIYNGHSFSNIGDTYTFSVDYTFDLNSKIRWYVYKNGGYYTNITTVNHENLEIELKESGSYTIMYYLETINGDNLFYNYEIINIE